MSVYLCVCGGGGHPDFTDASAGRRGQSNIGTTGLYEIEKIKCQLKIFIKRKEERLV